MFQGCGRVRPGDEDGAIARVTRLAEKNGDPGMTRTCDLRFRKPPLYPAELRDRVRLKRSVRSIAERGADRKPF